MDQLKFKDLAKLFEKLKKDYSVQEILEMPIICEGNDDCWYETTQCFEKDKEILIR